MFQGTALVKRGPLYHICASREEEAKRQAFQDRIREIRREAEEERLRIELANRPKELSRPKHVRKKRYLSATNPLLPVSDLPSTKFIREVVAAYYELEPSDLIGHSRKIKLCYARHVAFYITYKLTVRSLPEIGNFYGGRDHTTVLSGYKRIERLIKSGDTDVINDIREIQLVFSEHGIKHQYFWGS